MENTAEVAYAIVEEQVKSPEFEKIDPIQTRNKIINILKRLNIPRYGFLSFLIRKFKFVLPLNPKYPRNYTHRQRELFLRNSVLDKTIDVLHHDKVAHLNVVDLNEVTAVEVDPKEIIENLTTVDTSSKFPKSDLARRVSLLRKFTINGEDNADLYEGSERRMFDDFVKLDNASKDFVITKLIQQIGLN